MALKTFSSGEKQVQKPVEEVYALLGDFNNFRTLLPPQVSNFSSDTDSCSFSIEGMPPMSLRISEKIVNQLLVIVPDAGSPLPFEIHCRMRAVDTLSCLIEVVVSAELNPVMAMMLSRPLENFAGMIGNKLQEF